MQHYIRCIEPFLSFQPTPLIDVRSEGEYAKGHIPGAINIPLLNDEERAMVGLSYKTEGRRCAVLLGYRMVGHKFERYAKQALQVASDNSCRVYCWRGGMRSDIMAEIFVRVGIQTTVLDGGYKAFRRWVLSQFNRHFKFIVIGGKTGSGKTAILKVLGERGEQVIDLEALANHRGSAYGGIGRGAQPTNEHFQNQLAMVLAGLDVAKPVWIENESRMIGQIRIPDPLYDAIRSACVVEVSIPREVRLQRVLSEYATLPIDALMAATRRLEKRLGGSRMREALAFLEARQFEAWASMMLMYYDQTYAFSNQKRYPETVFRIECTNDNWDENVSRILDTSGAYLNMFQQQPKGATMDSVTTVQLTQFSHGAGCGCKISPAVLDQILKNHPGGDPFPGLLVGNATRDDAAVMDVGDGKAVISTTDFFMPIVDDPYDFGRIAAANAVSDVYAMGGKPLMAIAILGWPLDKLSPDVAAKVVDGARDLCRAAMIPLAGGHSIDAPEPIFGLAVTGIVDCDHIKSNATARAGDYLFLTKPLGIGIFATSAKREIISQEDCERMVAVMTTLNRLGERLGEFQWVTAMTDVTGFGLLGHLVEMMEGSGVAAEIFEADVPILNGLDRYIDKGCVPGGTRRNWESYGSKIAPISDRSRIVLCDPQTSGGLLIAVDPKHVDDFIEIADSMTGSDFHFRPIGRVRERLSGDDTGAYRVAVIDATTSSVDSP